MKQIFLLLATVCIFGLLTACGAGSTDEAVAPITGLGAGTVPTPTVPEAYANFTNPLKGDRSALGEGEALYQANCSSCHGPSGRGDGPVAGGLNPAPKDLASTQASVSDAYLFWRIKEGGLMEPFNSMMPAWKGLLEDDQIWQIILYLRQF